MLDVADISFPSQKQVIQEIPLTRNTIASRVNELAENLDFQLKIKEFIWYSLAADESTDIRDTSQLAVFIRGINEDFNITEELLQCIPLKSTTTAQDIYSAIEQLVPNYDLDWSKFCSITTDV
ncbi:general transcription factor II-I repeat domain-containing protein 2A-like [Centruroides vittatus]